MRESITSSDKTTTTLPATAPRAASPLAEIRALVGDGKRAEAEERLRQFVAEAPTTANLAAAARLWETWEANPLPGARTVRIAVLGEGTLGPLGAGLRVACAGIGLHPQVHVGEFGQWVQELLSPDSPVYVFKPEIISLYVPVDALFPKATREPFPDAVALAEEEAQGIATLLSAFRAASKKAPQSTVILHTFALPDYAPLGVYDLRAAGGQRERIERINHSIATAVRQQFPQVFLFDQERIEARFGKARVRDARRWYLASIPFSDEFTRVLALEYLRILRPLKGLTRKCIVLDLDNTLWGGVIGEDGLAGIKLGGTAAPGNAFRDFQAALDRLRQRGILLAICSKNNPEDAKAALEHHPEMLLRGDAFASVRINWEDKATNIASIARELNIGLESLVFMDDNPAECAQVRDRLPQVLTVALPRDPALYVETLLALDVFETAALTDEDRRRSEQYAEQRRRREFEQQFRGESFAAVASLEGAPGKEGDVLGYLRGLDIKVHLFPADAFTLPRIAQLINKTNQFNLTTRRYTESEVRDMVDRPDAFGVYGVGVSDRFGDSGLTGVAILHRNGEIGEVDSFLLSCRVLGRGIEQALLCYVAAQARAAGLVTMQGKYLPTTKNAPAADFYKRMGFAPIPGGGEGCQTWEAALTGASCPQTLADYPDWLAVSTADAEMGNQP